MNTKAVVIAVNDGYAEVIPVIKAACATCTAGCAKRGNSFPVANPKGFTLKKGMMVAITASQNRRTFEGMISLFIPFLSAIAGYVIANCFTSNNRNTDANVAPKNNISSKIIFL